ncbi:MAG TPA: AMP-binding protein, partial [Gemmatimonadaceae bacterium]|nr:AMP-binding protein [Gemmatimonadaceae bacterium]
MPPAELRSLWEGMCAHDGGPRGALLGIDSRLELSALAAGSTLGEPAHQLRGCSALVSGADQFALALALIQLDGNARRIVLCPPDLPAQYLPSIIEQANVDTVVSDQLDAVAGTSSVRRLVTCSRLIEPGQADRMEPLRTEWILMTSGTTGMPKMVLHTVSTLAGAINTSKSNPAVWATFYDTRRFGGLQILLRAILGGGSILTSDPRESVTDFLARAGEHGATHFTGTPTHWRRALMSPAARQISPKYVRLSGEVVDQALLDSLRALYPGAVVAHAFASTEAGVAYEVEDGLAGFPERLLSRETDGVDLKIEDDTLRVRSGRTARGYVGGGVDALLDPLGFV